MGRPRSKADFIRSQPPHMTAAEVVAKAAQDGIEISADYVYLIRSASRRRAPAGQRRLRAEFRRLVLELGLVEARRLLEEIEQGR